MTSTPAHPIRVVARRSGLSAEVIRAWELRYGVVSPARTPAGRRLYSDDDVERLSLLRRAVQEGRTIGQVARLPNDALRRLFDGERVAPALGLVTPDAAIAEALAALRRLDSARFEAVLRAAALTLSPPQLIEQVVAPLMRQVGDEWQAGTLSVAHEHLASAIARTVIGSLPRPVGLPAGAPTMVVATPAGQLHELGAMAVATVATASGWRVFYLGMDTPAAEIAAVVEQTGARLVAVSICYEHDESRLSNELGALRQALPARAGIVAGGRAAGNYRRVLDGVGALVLADTTALGPVLETARGAA